MCEIKINFDQVEKAIAVMRAAQIRRDGHDKAGHRGNPGRVPQSWWSTRSKAGCISGRDGGVVSAAHSG